MDARSLVGRSVFFVLICVFVSAFADVFGQGNSLAGVIVVVLALTMLSRDLSVRPLWNLGVVTACMLAMGAFTFIGSWFGEPLLAAVLNFAFVFCVCFYAMHDLNSPMHFPFLLGYAFMMSSPVTPEGLPARMLALLVGAVLVVGLNVLYHLALRGKDEREGFSGICDMVASMCVEVRAGSAADTAGLDRLCSAMEGRLYGRLRSRFVSRRDDRRLLDVTVSLRVLGGEVADTERDPDTLQSLEGILSDLKVALGGGDAEPAMGSIDTFLRSGLGGEETRAALRTIRDVLWRMGYDTGGGPPDRAEVPASFGLSAVLRESLRRDSARATFSFRMAVVFTACALVWQCTGEEDARALVFTSIAMVQPYLEGTARRTAYRLAGTAAGIAAAIAVMAVAGGDAATVGIAILAANYVFTVMSPMRYGAMMAFVTFSSLLTAAMSNPPDEIFTERVALIVVGVLIASAANRLILPYRIAEETRELCGRYLDITGRLIAGLEASASGRRDVMTETALTLRAATVSSKIRTNVTGMPDQAAKNLLARQDGLTARIRLLSGSLSGAGAECRRRVAEAVSSDGSEPDVSGLEPKEANMVAEAAGIARGYAMDMALLVRMRSGTQQV